MPLDLRKIRDWVTADCGDNQAEAARRLDMRPSHLSRLLGGDRDDVRISTLEHLADVMGIDPADLIRRAAIA